MPARKIKSLTRVLAMLKCIPVSPKFLTTTQIHAHLKLIDPDISIRTVQRDLMELTSIMGLEFGESPEGYKWSFAFDSPNQFIPAISKEEALTLKLVQQHLQAYLPSYVFQRLTALFKKSEQVLKNHPETENWSNLVRPMPQALPFMPLEINQEHIDVIYQALMEKSWLSIKYGAKDKYYKIKPLGVIIRESKLVLVCQYEGFDNIRNILIHRIKSAERLSETFSSSFSLTKYINKQAAAVLLNKEKIDLEFEAKGYVKQLLSESLLDESQVITTISNDWINVKLTIPHTVELENWLLSQLHNIRLLAPTTIKQRVLTKVKQALAINNEI